MNTRSHLGQKTPCGIQDEERKASIGWREDRRIDLQEQVAGCMDLPIGFPIAESKARPTNEWLEAALGLAFLVVPIDQDIDGLSVQEAGPLLVVLSIPETAERTASGGMAWTQSGASQERRPQGAQGTG